MKKDIDSNFLLLPIEELDLNITEVKKLKKNNIVILNDIVNTDILKIEEIISNKKTMYLIKTFIHSNGYIIKNEFKDLNISKKLLVESINSLNITNYLKTILINNGGILIIGDLLSRSYNEIIKVNDMNDTLFLSLKKELNKCGLHIQDEEKVFDEIKLSVTNSKETLIDGIFSKELCDKLNNNGIFSLEILVEYIEKVLSLKDLSENDKKIIIKVLSDMNILFNDNNLLIYLENELNNTILKKEKLDKYYDDIINLQKEKIDIEKKKIYGNRFIKYDKI